MFELLQTFFTTTSFFHIVSGLAELTVTEMMVIFLLSKPLFIIIAIGALFSGRSWAEAHYLHHQRCDRFLTESSKSFNPSDR